MLATPAPSSSIDKHFYYPPWNFKVGENEADGQIKTVPTLAAGSRALTALEFQGLAEMPAEMEWFAHIDNPRTRKACRIDLADFMKCVGIQRPEEFRIVTRAHFIAWRRSLEGRGLATPTIRLIDGMVRRKQCAPITKLSCSATLRPDRVS